MTETDRDIVEHLRSAANVAIGTFYSIGGEALMLRAADQITALRSENEALRCALQRADSFLDGWSFETGPCGAEIQAEADEVLAEIRALQSPTITEKADV